MRKIHVTTAKQYADLLWPEFTAVGDCVFLATEWAINSHLYEAENPTQSEWNMSHTHVVDLVRHAAGTAEEPFYNPEHPDFRIACEFGKILCATWAAKLLNDFPDQDFRIYYHGFDPIVRFHKVRPGVPNCVEDTDWAEEVRDGSCLILDTRKIRKHNK